LFFFPGIINPLYVKKGPDKRGKGGNLTPPPPGKMDEKLNSENM